MAAPATTTIAWGKDAHMASLQALLDEVAAAADNVESAHAARNKLVTEFGNDEKAAPQVTEALYRLGLTTLLHKKELDAAMELFKRAADRKDPSWSPLARTSYALTLAAKGKHQQCIFELRKVIGKGPPTAAVATALTLLTVVLRDSGAKPSEIEK